MIICIESSHLQYRVTMKHVSYCMLLINYMLVVVTTDECNIHDCLEKNTLCVYPDPNKFGPACSEKANLSFEQDIKDIILDRHNAFRSNLAMGLTKDKNDKPFLPASNMMQLEWDKELEDLAHRWLIQCVYEHDKCRSTHKFKRVGQNAATRTDNNYVASVENWQIECSKYDSKKDLEPQGYTTGHFTQLNWATSTHIGCAGGLALDIKLKYLLFCDYGPAGNILKTDMYKTGNPCTKCPEGSSCSRTYEGLCTSGQDGGAPFPKPYYNSAANYAANIWLIAIAFSRYLIK